MVLTSIFWIFSKNICRLQKSNPRPTDYKSVALPAELNQQIQTLARCPEHGNICCPPSAAWRLFAWTAGAELPAPYGNKEVRKEGYYYETDDFHASPVSAQMKPCDQDWGKENLDVSGAVPLPENNCIIPYMWYPVNVKTQYIVSKL